MNKKTGYAFRIVLGGYLAWIGIRMIMQMINERPSNMVMMCVMGIIFVLVGAPYAIYSLKKVWDMRKEELGGEEEDSPDLQESDGSDAQREVTSGKVSLQKLDKPADEMNQMEKPGTTAGEEHTAQDEEELSDSSDNDNGQGSDSSGESDIAEGKSAPVRTTVIELDENEEDTDIKKTAVEEEIESDYEEK